jgi:hypothetical protein
VYVDVGVEATGYAFMYCVQLRAFPGERKR